MFEESNEIIPISVIAWLASGLAKNEAYTLDLFSELERTQGCYIHDWYNVAPENKLKLIIEIIDDPVKAFSTHTIGFWEEDIIDNPFIGALTISDFTEMETGGYGLQNKYQAAYIAIDIFTKFSKTSLYLTIEWYPFSLEKVKETIRIGVNE